MQTTDTLLMIEPVAFGYNAETAQNNYFQINQSNNDTQNLALAEFHAFVEMLRKREINVIVVKDTLEPHTPDSIFPNNWMSFHENGVVALYPMFAKNRQLERRPDVLQTVADHGFILKDLQDYTLAEKEGKYLEGTGSMILDRENKIAYGAESIRLDPELFQQFCVDFGYKAVQFKAMQTVNATRMPIYHTNVMMCVADKYAVICLDSIDNVEERREVQNNLMRTGKEIIPITEAQMHQFAGNMLQVHNKNGIQFLIMSDAAYQSLSEEQIKKISEFNDIIHPKLHHIETNGGGSARCMLAEVFLPKKTN